MKARRTRYAQAVTFRWPRAWWLLLFLAWVLLAGCERPTALPTTSNLPSAPDAPSIATPTLAATSTSAPAAPTSHTPVLPTGTAAVTTTPPKPSPTPFFTGCLLYTSPSPRDL
ncbi:MAG: hypothetical protein IAE79_28100, partial [Anaerolinea sp.]|nr:hypothetical protein [Anaerolinea sp.]